MGGAHADVSGHVKMYIAVFAALAIGTIVTVLASTVDLGGHWNVAVAMAIAAVKASLVAAIFMHLKWESASVIWITLLFCAIFLVVLMALPVLTSGDRPPMVQIGSWG
ncbi:MAG: cytochrome C oxidase subunit IV family protein [Planctomycetota bacterium]